MNDYFIDEKILKDFRKSVQPNKEPLNYPTEKVRKLNNNLSTKNLSNNATQKKEYNDLLSNYRNLEKAYNKLNKKYSEICDDLKNLKSSNDSLSKEINVLHITNEKLMGEKINAENVCEENKSYLRKLESRLVQGAKNQYLVEINNKLRKEIEEINEKNEENERLGNEIFKKNKEIKILNKALDLQVDELKYKGDIKSSLLYDVGICKNEIDECKENYEKASEENTKFKLDIEEKDSKIQELSFAKAHLTELLVEIENKSHNLEVEKTSYEKHCLELKEERKMLREYIEKIVNDSNEINENLNKDNVELSNKCKELENYKENSEEIITKLTGEGEGLKTLNSQANERIKVLENSLKNKIDEFIELEVNYKNLEKIYNELDEKNNATEDDKENLINNVGQLHKQISELEKENMDLIKKNKVLLISQENLQTENIKQNQIQQNNENKTKEQNQKLSNDIENLRQERDELKKIISESLSKCGTLIKEKNDLEKDLMKKTQQIENLKNTNLILHKNLSIGNENKNLIEQINTLSSPANIKNINSLKVDTEDSETNKQKIIKIGKEKIEENNMLSLIRKEKEKNKEFLNELKLLKNNY